MDLAYNSDELSEANRGFDLKNRMVRDTSVELNRRLRWCNWRSWILTVAVHGEARRLSSQPWILVAAVMDLDCGSLVDSLRSL